MRIRLLHLGPELALADDDAERLLRDHHLGLAVGIAFLLDNDRDPGHEVEPAQMLGDFLENVIDAHFFALLRSASIAPEADCFIASSDGSSERSCRWRTLLTR